MPSSATSLQPGSPERETSDGSVVVERLTRDEPVHLAGSRPRRPMPSSAAQRLDRRSVRISVRDSSAAALRPRVRSRAPDRDALHVGWQLRSSRRVSFVGSRVVGARAPGRTPRLGTLDVDERLHTSALGGLRRPDPRESVRGRFPGSAAIRTVSAWSSSGVPFGDPRRPDVAPRRRGRPHAEPSRAHASTDSPFRRARRRPAGDGTGALSRFGELRARTRRPSAESGRSL